MTDLRSKAEREAAERKIKDWQKVGVRIIWAINPEKKTVKVYHPDQPEPVKVLGLNDVLEGEEIIPGFTMPVADLFK